ncbi:MAG: trimethylamine methyltransferase family protein [Acidobacteriota bacterium]|nr:trimethylamine methyltransferase family protein [Acidobacteriota bacterium]
MNDFREHSPLRSLPHSLRLEILAPATVEKVHDETLAVLETVGVTIASSDLCDRLAAAGGDVDRARHRVRFPAALVEQALARAPDSFTLAARRPEADLLLDGTAGFLSVDGCAAEILDLETGRRRASTKADLAMASRLADALPEISLLWQPVSARDVPRSAQSLHELHAQVANSTKHIQMMTAVNPRAARGVVEIARVVAGGGDELRKRPILSAFQCSLSPLTYEEGALDAAVVFAEAGVPCGFVVMPISCATAPATVAGGLVQSNAEILSGIVALQLLVPGAATFYGACTTVMDLRSGAAACGGPEDLLFQMAAAQMARHYRLPSSVGTFATGAKSPSWQGGLENGLSGLASCLAGADLLCGAGLVYSAQVFSLEEMVLDCEVFGLLRHLVGLPAQVAAEPSSLPILEEVGPGGHYLDRKHTLQNMRRQWMPRFFDRTSWEGDEAPAGDHARRAAAARARELLSAHEPEPLDESVEREILAILETYGKHEGEAADG